MTMPPIQLIRGLLASALAFALTSAAYAEDPAAPEETPNHTPLMNLFPPSSAPTYFQHASNFVLKKELDWWERDKKWHPEIDEKSVFHATLQHRAVAERSWELGIGKGGQIYSMYSTFGEAMAPSSPHSQWNDEVWQFTTIYEHLLGRDLPDHPEQAPMKNANAYVHGSGIYTKQEGDTPFYSPLLAEAFNEEERTYTILNWGQIPHASINRSGILIYTQYRDLGGGVIEVTYLIYNFEDEPMTNLGPWGGVRTSVFPEHVVSNPDGSYRFFSPWSYGFDKLEGCRIHFEDTGGWAAATANADNPHSHAIAVVFGKQLDKKGDHYGKPRYDCGDSRHGKRDYTVQATVINIKDKPGTPHLLRMYFVLGTLDKVAAKANQLADHADYEPLNLTEADTPTVPLYRKRIGGDTVLSREDNGKHPVCAVYAWPVNGSVPLFLIKNNQTGKHFVTSDPYAQCARDPFVNPLTPEDASFQKYEDRTIYRPAKRQTEWVELLGYVMPKDKARDTGKYTPLAEAPVACSFDPGHKHPASDLMIIGR